MLEETIHFTVLKHSGYRLTCIVVNFKPQQDIIQILQRLLEE